MAGMLLFSLYITQYTTVFYIIKFHSHIQLIHLHATLLGNCLIIIEIACGKLFDCPIKLHKWIDCRVISKKKGTGMLRKHEKITKAAS